MVYIDCEENIFRFFVLNLILTRRILIIELKSQL